MNEARIWEWRTFLGAEIPHEGFWSVLGVSADLRRELMQRAKVRTDAYVDLQDIRIGVKGRKIDAEGLPSRLEVKVRTAKSGALEEWVKVLRHPPPRDLRLHGDHGARRALEVLRHASERSGQPPGILSSWLDAGRNNELRIVRIHKVRTRLHVACGPRGWSVLQPVGGMTTAAFPQPHPDADRVLVEHTDLALEGSDGKRRPLGWTVCCERARREPVDELSMILGRLGGRVMGYPRWIREIPV